MENAGYMKRANSYLALLIFLIPFLLFSHTLPYPFIELDDYLQILENPFLKNFSWPVFWDLFSRFHFGQYNPLLLLSFVLDYSIWNAEPYGFRLTNLILHALNGMLLYFILRKMKVGIISSFTVCFLFLCHPVQVEPFIWISARKYVLSAFLMLTSFTSHITFRESNARRDQMISAVCFFATLLTSSLSAIFPLITLAYDYFYLKRAPISKLVKEHFIFLIVALIMGIVFIQAARSQGYFRHYYIPQNWLMTWAAIPILTWRYVFLGFFPLHQSFMYDSLWTESIRNYVIADLALAGAIFYLFKKRKSQGEFVFWVSWFLIFLMPTLFLPRHSVLHDRYLYLPLIGLAMAVTVSFNKLTDSWRANRFRKGIVFISISLVLITYAFCSWKRSLVWQDNFILISDARQKAPNHYFSHQGMALEWIKRGNYELAHQELDQALKAPVTPSSYKATYNAMAKTYFLEGNYPAAIEMIKKALALSEKDLDYIDLGVYYGRVGQFDNAIQANMKALELGTKRAEVYNNLGAIYERRKEFVQALDAYRRAVKLNPDLIEAFQNFTRLIKENPDLTLP